MCLRSCRNQFCDPAGWCSECWKEDQELSSRQYEEHIHETEARRIAAIPAATDAEWSVRLDEIAPKVGDQAVEYRKLRLRPMPPGKPLPRRIASDDQTSFEIL